MKKSYFLLPLFLLCIHSISSAQSKNYFGIGTSFDINKSIAATNNDNDLQPADANFKNNSIHTFLNLNTNKPFQFRVNTRLNAKTIRFTSEDLAAFGDIMINNLDLGFLAVDVGVSSLYTFPLNENNKLLPVLGIFGSYNFNTNGYGLSRNDGTLSAEEILNGIPTQTNKSRVAYIGLNTGLLYQTTIKNRAIEFYTMFYLTPNNSFEATFEYENMDDMTYIGKQRSIALGVNLPIFLKKR